ncbi:hypothetical protein M422DRAFT_27379 [Sphaerobolus stellatus SS14]|nr:hypothetical protein M422DRAFT_27379 [Sphaerobolus stellatus SS14]
MDQNISSSEETSPRKSSDKTLSLMEEILDTLHASELFTKPRKDDRTQFWTVYERVAKQHDEEFLDRRNVDLDSLLIFARILMPLTE